MHRVHTLRRAHRILIELVLAAALSPGSFGHVLAQTASQEVQVSALSPAPQIVDSMATGPVPAQTAAPVLARHTYLPVISGALSVPRQVIAALNEARRQVGCAPLRIDSRLMQTAQAHSADMAAHAFLSHEGSDGSLPADRVESAGYSISYVGETILHENSSDAEHAVARWLESDAHRAILLHCTTQDIGAGVSLPYWTVVVANSF